MHLDYKRVTLILALFFSFSFAFSQHMSYGGDGLFEGRFGFTAGVTNYSPDASFLFSKSSTGFKVGFIGTVFISEKFEAFVELNYARHSVKFVGRETELAPQEDIKFNLENFNIPITIDYTVLNLDDEWFFGVNAGPSLSLIHNYKLADDSKSDYVLDPLYAKPSALEFDSNKETLSVNVFLALGLSVEYKQFMATFRYNKGLTDPYKKINLASPVLALEGKDNYFELSFSFFLEEKL